MTTYTISPVPVAGGTMSVSPSRAHWTHLSGDKFLIVYMQTNPNHVYAQVVTYNGQSSAPTSGPARMIRQNMSTAPSYIRVVGISETKAVVYYSYSSSTIFEHQFISIDASDNIVESSSTISSLTPSTSRQTFIYKLSPTKQRILYADVGVSKYVTRTLTIDPVSETITPETLLDTGIPSTNNASVNLYRRINSSTVSEIISYSSTYVYNILNNDGEVVSTPTLTGSWPTSKLVFPLNENRSFFATSSTNYTRLYVIDNYNYPSSYITAGTFGLSNTANIIPLDNNHVMCIGENSSSLTATVVRLISDGIADLSPSTNKSGGMSLNMGGLSTLSFWDYQVYPPHQRDISTYIYWFVSSGKIGFKSIYQPTT